MDRSREVRISMGRPQRRVHRRAALESPVLVHTIASRFDGVMEDISVSGARIRLRGKPPRIGRDLVVRWSGQEAFGVVVWVSGERVGVAFHQNLPGHMLSHLIDSDEPVELEPYAGNFRRI
jgi:hypothetical protein